MENDLKMEISKYKFAVTYKLLSDSQIEIILSVDFNLSEYGKFENETLIPISTFSHIITDLHREFMFKNPFFSNKKGLIESNEPILHLIDLPFEIHIDQRMVVDSNVYSVEDLRKLFKSIIYFKEK